MVTSSERQLVVGDFVAAYFLKCQILDIERNSVVVPLKKLKECSSSFGALSGIRQKEDFKTAIGKLQQYCDDRNGRHPKLAALEHIILKHFEDHSQRDAQACGSGTGAGCHGKSVLTGANSGTRVMVFASSRDWVEEIVMRYETWWHTLWQVGGCF